MQGCFRAPSTEPYCRTEQWLHDLQITEVDNRYRFQASASSPQRHLQSPASAILPLFGLSCTLPLISFHYIYQSVLHRPSEPTGLIRISPIGDIHPRAGSGVDAARKAEMVLGQERSPGAGHKARARCLVTVGYLPRRYWIEMAHSVLLYAVDLKLLPTYRRPAYRSPSIAIMQP